MCVHLDGLNAEHKFRVWVRHMFFYFPYGKTSRRAVFLKICFWHFWEFKLQTWDSRSTICWCDAHKAIRADRRAVLLPECVDQSKPIFELYNLFSLGWSLSKIVHSTVIDWRWKTEAPSCKHTLCFKEP